LWVGWTYTQLLLRPRLLLKHLNELRRELEAGFQGGIVGTGSGVVAAGEDGVQGSL
jgi:hypothetical protein